PDLAPAKDPALQRHALVDPVLAADDHLEHGLEVTRLGLRQEADLAQVDPEKRYVHLRHRPGGPQERAVAAEHDEEVGRRQLAQERLHLAGRRLPLGDAANAAPARSARAELDRRLDRRVVREPDPRDGHRLAVATGGGGGATAASIRSPMSAQPGPGARWTRNSRLPSGPVSGDAMTSRVPRPAACACSTVRSRTSRWI